MSGVLSLTTLLAMYGVSEAIAKKTHAIIDTVLTISILGLAGFWTGILPKNLFSNSGVESFGMAVVGLMLTGLGTTINLAELKRQRKVVLIAICGATGSAALIVLVALLLHHSNYGIVGAPIFAGGNAATLVLLSALRSHHLQLLSTYALAVLTFQNFIGIPVATFVLRREAQRVLTQGKLTSDGQDKAQPTDQRKLLAIPTAINSPIVCLAKLGLVASLAYGTSLLIHGAINYLVICFVFGILFYQLGFLEANILDQTASNGMITFLVTIVILASLAETTPQAVVSVIVPLFACLLVGTIGVVITSLISSKIFNISIEMAIALGMTCTFGFPTTMILSQEIAMSVGRNAKEQAALEKLFLPQMVTAGLVTVTLISVFFAGFAIRYLH